MTNKNCSNCGEPATGTNAKSCSNCGKPYPQTESEKENVCSAEKIGYVKEKSSFFAVLLSFVSPGLGQVYNGRLKKGLLMLLINFVGIFLAGIPSLLVWFYSIYDANNEANKVNKGELPFVEATGKDAIIYLAALLILLVILIILYFVFIFFMMSLMMASSTYGY